MIPLSRRATRCGDFAREPCALDQADIAAEDRFTRVGDFVADPAIFPTHGFPLQPGTSGGLFRLVECADHRATVYVSLGAPVRPAIRRAGYALTARHGWRSRRSCCACVGVSLRRRYRSDLVMCQ